MSNTALARPYLMTDWPKSDGRTFLAHAFAFFCVLEWGHSFEEMDAGLDPASGCDERVRGQVIGAAQNFGRVIQQDASRLTRGRSGAGSRGSCRRAHGSWTTSAGASGQARSIPHHHSTGTPSRRTGFS